MKAKVTVRLKSGVLDPQGKAVLHAANSLGYDVLSGVRVGKIFEIDLGDTPQDQATSVLEELSAKLLANTVIENYEVELLD